DDGIKNHIRHPPSGSLERTKARDAAINHTSHWPATLSGRNGANLWQQSGPRSMKQLVLRKSHAGRGHEFRSANRRQVKRAAYSSDLGAAAIPAARLDDLVRRLVGEEAAQCRGVELMPA